MPSRWIRFREHLAIRGKSLLNTTAGPRAAPPEHSTRSSISSRRSLPVFAGFRSTCHVYVSPNASSRKPVQRFAVRQIANQHALQKTKVAVLNVKKSLSMNYRCVIALFISNYTWIVYEYALFGYARVREVCES